MAEKEDALYQDKVRFLVGILRQKLLSKANNTTEEFLLRKIFRDFDTNESGDLTVDELWAMMAKLEISCERKYLLGVFKQVD